MTGFEGQIEGQFDEWLEQCGVKIEMSDTDNFF